MISAFIQRLIDDPSFIEEVRFMHGYDNHPPIDGEIRFANPYRNPYSPYAYADTFQIFRNENVVMVTEHDKTPERLDRFEIVDGMLYNDIGDCDIQWINQMAVCPFCKSVQKVEHKDTKEKVWQVRKTHYFTSAHHFTYAGQQISVIDDSKLIGELCEMSKLTHARMKKLSPLWCTAYYRTKNSNCEERYWENIPTRLTQLGEFAVAHLALQCRLDDLCKRNKLRSKVARLKNTPKPIKSTERTFFRMLDAAHKINKYHGTTKQHD